jgi:hypothetical protein
LAIYGLWDFVGPLLWGHRLGSRTTHRKLHMVVDI